MTDTIQDIPAELRIMTAAFDWNGQDTHALNVLQSAADRIDELERALGDILNAPDLNTAKSRAVVALPTLNAKSPASG